MNSSRRKLILFNKPYDVLCQFTDRDNIGSNPGNNSNNNQRKTLADFIDVPGVYPVSYTHLTLPTTPYV